MDAGGSNLGMDRYAEQLWLTMFAKAPEIALFAYNQLIGVALSPETHRTPWQGQGTSFDYDEMMKPVKTAHGEVVPTTLPVWRVLPLIRLTVLCTSWASLWASNPTSRFTRWVMISCKTTSA
ncbi:hypothetical protein Barb7_01885 [Bacteroidales bacterium Barb7]|nr:hypothetical protein Barb7_01885 [Bacteroidales bacterium Barb7]